MSTKITPWPKELQWDAVSTTVRPVTVTAEVEVKKALTQAVWVLSTEAMGRARRNAAQADKEGKAVEKDEGRGEDARGGTAYSKAEHPGPHVPQPGASNYALVGPG